jgi:hypothetical protein
MPRAAALRAISISVTIRCKTWNAPAVERSATRRLREFDGVQSYDPALL